MKRSTAIVLALLLLGAGAGQAAAADGRLQKIAASNTITIAYRSDAAPFSFTEGGKEPEGFSIDLCVRVAQSLASQLNLGSLKVNWHPVSVATRFDAVARGQADMECGSSTVTLTRMKQVDFSSYIFVESTGLLIRGGTGIRSVSDLGGRTIAVIGGTTNENVIRAQIKGRKLEAKVVAFETQDEAIAALESGRADAFASDKLLLIGAALKAKDPKALSMLPEDLSFEPYGIVLPRGDTDFRLAVNTALAGIFGSGEIDRIFGRWFSRFGEPGPVIRILYLLGAIPN